MKSRPVKASSTDDAGRFTALVSVFGNIDRDGDVVMPGAFARTLEERGLPPVYYSHQWPDLRQMIGMTDAARETEQGLEIEAHLWLDVSESARIAHRAFREGALREFSFAYEVVESAEEVREGEPVRLLKDLELFEVGPTLVGMNPATALIDVRSRRPHAEPEPEPDMDEEGGAIVALPRGLLLARPR